VSIAGELSCPKLDGGQHLFAHSVVDTRDAITAVVGALDPGRSGPNSPRTVTDIGAIAEAAIARARTPSR